MELHQVRYFLAVASTLNFTRAAEQCNVTQPALTKGVQKLEQELGGQLIYRERQLTQLTDLGKKSFRCWSARWPRQRRCVAEPRSSNARRWRH
jgi:DNA-binding transcriptional LysR family regulator